MSLSLATKGYIGGHGTGNIAAQLAAIKADTTFIKAIEGGRWKIISNQMIFYNSDNITEIARFNLLDATALPTMTNPFERVRV